MHMMVITSDETQIQIFADWPNRLVRNVWQNPEYPVVVAKRRQLQKGKNCLAKIPGQTMLKMIVGINSCS